jgi:small subunit ribosomal protein S8
MDTIADFITRIRNGYLAKRREVIAPYARLSETIARMMVEEGYLASVSVKDAQTRRGSTVKHLSLTLKYQDGQSALTGITRVSTVGRRRYVSAKQLPRVLGGYGMAIVSTSSGIMSDRAARKKGVGGEIVCTVW